MIDIPFITKKKNSKNTSEVTFEAPVPDFIPYACHYNSDTILNKNGEILQVIKITGFSDESVEGKRVDLREIIRRTVKDNIKSDNFSLWLHTIRRKKSINPEGTFPDGFSRNLNQAWKERNNWENQYINELYITVLYDGKGANDPKEMMSTITFPILKTTHEKQLEKSYQILDQVVEGMLKTLSEHGARRLGLVKRNGVFYSEILQFFSKILNLVEQDIPMPLNDLSNYLANHKVAFGFNTIEVLGKAGKRFAAIFTMKEYHELTSNSLDAFLQLPQEFIISQTLDFIGSSQALPTYEEQIRILGLSGDKKLAEISGLQNVIDSKTGSETDYAQSQITILFINDDISKLEKQLFKSVAVLRHLGYVVVRRDLRMEECFWAQLPGNFAFISRKMPINTSKVGGFSSLYNFPVGHSHDNHWGPCVTAFRTANGKPYFFNFHSKDSGHTSIIGPRGSGKTVLMNFLVSESRKFNCKLFFFDQERASKVFITAMNGNYTIINPESPSGDYAYNPFLIDDTPENKEFLCRWMVCLAESGGTPINDQEKEHMRKLVDYMYSLPYEQRRLSSVANSFGENRPGSLAEKMQDWHSGGKYAHLFDNQRGSVIEFKDIMYGFGMSYVVKNPQTLGPVLMYLFHRINMMLDGSPVMVVLDEAWSLVNNPIFGPGLGDWLDKLRQNNAMVIFATESMENANKSEITNTIASRISTQIFLPNKRAMDSSIAYQQVWGLSKKEYRLLSVLEVEKRHFLIRQEGNTIAGQLDLANMDELYVLSGGDDTVAVMDSVRQPGEPPEQWLPRYYEEIKKVRKPSAL